MRIRSTWVVLRNTIKPGLVKPITKWTRLVAQTDRLPEYVGTGFRKALGGRPGPVHLNVPYDVLYDKIDDAEIDYPEPANSRANGRVHGDPGADRSRIEVAGGCG